MNDKTDRHDGEVDRPSPPNRSTRRSVIWSTEATMSDGVIDQLRFSDNFDNRTMADGKQEHSDLWKTSRDEVESEGGDWDEHRKQALATVGLNNLRKAASVIESLPASPTVGKDELARKLTEADCFLGPIGDDTIYQERDGQAVPIAGRRGVPSQTRWVAFEEGPDNDE